MFAPRRTARSCTDACAPARRAFTMIEILIVIGILAILAAIVLLGMRHITGRSKEQQTRLTLQNLRNMLAEYENATKLGKGPEKWGWYTGATGRRTVMKGEMLYTDPATGAPVNADFWRVPDMSDIEDATRAPAPMDAPGSVDVGNPRERNGTRQLMFTQLAMNYVFSVPANRSALQGLPADRMFTPEWTSGDLAAPGADRVLMTNGDSVEQVYYYVGNRVLHDKTYYRCTTEHQAGSPPPGGAWVVEGQETATVKTSATPILLDGWNNPILLVPATGLRVRLLNGEKSLDPTKPGQTALIISPEGTSTPPAMPNVPGKLVRAGKPFFVSAGPDGDFAKGDDNIYSFEE
jgi:prepilin-type N-terminal cleavage/methylation domain-containing protein